ncbi:3-oxoacyl-[acyl-carrier-protein] synthase 2 [Variibacter gotjawalensis]|uniref:3-oxoacyl-[acyl-carrier-protein] synthase 2 n=1 Tax=Variibacter gotjawalensis TaxID=1333996 RepID=A0A0S3PYY6_9BRAD|nr:beta-ketoacyl-ACP synthase [Variibacter gotjawalensis]NIK46944.1 3-oxoacyl-[acyl-carrier-protein] synthase II [Variibacter gotjawalensis]RZS48848.1 3-oxoacyl-[acyl-carrier-protein] synthase II [Variibacter gotjawalensis]BAT61107.1 3-oxoacyl-[acyl-carrier-protein] synthase 2 [Variibacter gotjawalensis]
MPDAPREVWITGIGIVSSLGEGRDAHWQALSEGRSGANTELQTPYTVYPIVPLNYDQQIAKKGDQRQMEAWQRIGTYAAGLALDDAGLKGNTEILSRMDLIVAAGGGERDLNVDSAVLSGRPKAENPDAFLNERLMSDLRPTLFLAQLSNLLAGNISIVHGVTGSSRTFMGEEAAGVDAIRIAFARIRAGQGDIALVGSAYNGERKEMVLNYEFGSYNRKGAAGSVWDGKGFSLGSLGAFLVIESKEHAEKRGAKPLARIASVAADQTKRQPGAVTGFFEKALGALDVRAGESAVVSGVSGAAAPTAEERDVLGKTNIPVRATQNQIGHGLEVQFPMNIALATLALQQGSLYPSQDKSGVEKDGPAKLTQVLVTGIGHWRGEGLALIEATH